MSYANYDDDEFEDEDDEFCSDTGDADLDDGLAYQRMLARQGVTCKCVHCGTKFTGMPDHSVCDPCADSIERGGDPGYADDDPSEGF